MATDTFGQLRPFEYFPNTGPSLMPSLNMNIRAFLFSAVLLTLSMDANAGLFGFGGDSWKEEVLLHDGSKLVVKRSQTYGGRHEIGQPPPTKEHTINFTLPGSHKSVTWISEYGEELGRTNFDLLAVHILNGTPYLVTSPNLCLSYNKWGRPNPPYVFLRYDGTAWQRIPLEEFPVQFKTLNVAINLSVEDVRALVSFGTAPAEKIRELNSELRQPEYKTILREPAKPGTQEGSSTNCPDYNSERYRSPKAPLPMKPLNESQLIR